MSATWRAHGTSANHRRTTDLLNGSSHASYACLGCPCATSIGRQAAAYPRQRISNHGRWSHEENGIEAGSAHGACPVRDHGRCGPLHPDDVVDCNRHFCLQHTTASPLGQPRGAFEGWRRGVPEFRAGRGRQHVGAPNSRVAEGTRPPKAGSSRTDRPFRRPYARDHRTSGRFGRRLTSLGASSQESVFGLELARSAPVGSPRPGRELVSRGTIV